MFLDSQKKMDCCGCMACSQVCGVSAITMKQDKQGFYYPVVDTEKCVNCGLCRKVCPMEENYVGQNAEPDIYALRNRDSKVLNSSSSGGTFTLLAKWILERNGVIYGVAFDREYRVKHMRAECMETAGAFRTSKYVESDISAVYRDISQDLRDGRKVLLTGTPCQISGVLKFLRTKKVNMENLYTCDNICHGVPSRKIWKDYISILKKKYIAEDDEIISVNMRSKKVSWKQQVMDVKLRKGNIDEVVEEFSFNKFFLSLFGNRPSCFRCRYTSYKRPSDFTLGDFWNVENANVPFDIEGGVNVVLINTEKGKQVFSEICKEAQIHKVTKQAGWQPHLEYSAKPPKKQDEFWKEYCSTEDKEAVMRKYMKGSFLSKLIRIATPVLTKVGLYGFAGKMYKVLLVRKKNIK